MRVIGKINIFTLFLLLTCTTSAFAKCEVKLKDFAGENYFNLLSLLDSHKINCSGFEIYKGTFPSNPEFFLNSALTSSLDNLTLSSFDMGERIDSSNFNGYIFSTYFWQKNKEYNGMSLTMFVAHNTKTNKTMIVLTDFGFFGYKYVKILGDKDKELLTEIIKHRQFPLELLLSTQVKQAFDLFFNDN